MKAVVAAFNQEKAPSRGLLRAYEPSDGTFSSTTEHWAVSGEENDFLMTRLVAVVEYREHHIQLSAVMTVFTGRVNESIKRLQLNGTGEERIRRKDKTEDTAGL